MKTILDATSGSVLGIVGLFLVLLLNDKACDAGITSKYVRRLQASIDLPLDSPHFSIPPGHNAPEQVHITQGDYEGRAIVVSWITPSPSRSKVVYGITIGKYDHEATGSVTRYTFFNYTSGYIHHTTLNDLEFDTTYHYKLGNGTSAREFSFTTPPKVGPDVPYTFGIIGDLGQTYDSLNTFQHYLSSKGKTLLFVGDLSYADNYPFDYNVRWDTWGRLVEPSTAYQPWIWTAGNHEIEFRPDIGETVPFKPYAHRYHVPYLASNSTSHLWYAIKRASVHIIVLSSYSAYGKYTPQWVWLQTELAKVDRTVTPWLIVLVHSPLYNSNVYHYMEGETFRVQFESWFVKYKVDIIFSGHVHAYERSHRISNVAYNIVNTNCTPILDDRAPVYVTIGDGGNIEGIAGNFTEPQPAYSAFREASFGHAILDIKSRTHALFYWHRNQDGNSAVGDSYLLLNRFYSA
ncbi:hypothetical protein O6H91_06G038900 [Diphasiastrum complanatum]|uniref:Uncharacterized protein n=2 Tax=Diphasiastrum complanatum TaxID=34168 RepID=A0ACC2DCW0_DIPCM|nr:hypothetical protein O6H91_06G038900 [Diphasiastrum complanatum]KAJ7552023.1 hypothetical protein O6H91_06G038900 [Diphasiastrum complanatum]